MLEVVVTMQVGVGEDVETKKMVNTYETKDRAEAIAMALEDCDFVGDGDRLQVNVNG